MKGFASQDKAYFIVTGEELHLVKYGGVAFMIILTLGDTRHSFGEES
jgi:hypothetical protein